MLHDPDHLRDLGDLVYPGRCDGELPPAPGGRCHHIRRCILRLATDIVRRKN